MRLLFFSNPEDSLPQPCHTPGDYGWERLLPKPASGFFEQAFCNDLEPNLHFAMCSHDG